MKKAIIIIALIVLVIAGATYFNLHKGLGLPSETGTTATSTTSTRTLISSVSYRCDSGKTIAAAYYAGSSTSATATSTVAPATADGSTLLTLSDGRTLTLGQTVSADGGRYSSADGTIVFWNKGNAVTFTENNQETYAGCMQVAQDPGGLPQVYASSSAGFSLRYPANYSVNDSYKYQALGPNKDIPSVQFMIDPAMATGTNLMADSYVSVEKIPNPTLTACIANRFLDTSSGKVSPRGITEGNTTYSVASTTGVGAGNHYEETVYSIPGTNPCIAVRYFIHSTVLGNYPTGTVRQFDEAALMLQFDAIRKSLVLTK